MCTCFFAIYSRPHLLSTFSTIRSLTNSRAVSENAADGRKHSTGARLLGDSGRYSRSTLHLVQGDDEETSCGRRPVHPLHLPQMRLSTHHALGIEAPCEVARQPSFRHTSFVQEQRIPFVSLFQSGSRTVHDEYWNSCPIERKHDHLTNDDAR